MDNLKKIKRYGKFNLLLIGILAFTVLYALTLHIRLYENYMQTLPDNERTASGWAVIGIVLLSVIGAIALSVTLLLLVGSTVALLKATKPKRTAIIFSIVFQFLTAVGFLFFFASCYNAFSVIVFTLSALSVLAVAIYGIRVCATLK